LARYLVCYCGMEIASVKRQRTQPKDYCLIERLGYGSGGVVYRARQTALNREVAIKLAGPDVAQDPELRLRFRREATLQASLSHPNLVKVLDAGLEGSKYCWLAMELINGPTLATFLAQRGPLPLGLLIRISGQISEALQYLHGRGVVHRDIKPANILLSACGTVKVADLGMCLDESRSQMTKTGTLVGTLSYMAPELFRGEPATGAADIYALGLVMYMMATGVLPLEADTMAGWVAVALNGRVNPASVWRADLPLALDHLILRMLSKDPKQRPVAAEVTHLLEEALLSGHRMRPRARGAGRVWTGRSGSPRASVWEPAQIAA